MLVGAAGAAVILLVLLLTGLVLIAKRKRAHSAVVPPPNKSILKKERDYVLPTSGLDNTAFLTPDSEGKVCKQIYFIVLNDLTNAYNVFKKNKI